jgi:hypothetical protein
MGSSQPGSQEQEQAIKARKQLLFEAEEPTVSIGDQTPFAEFLRTTPAAPLPLWIKAALGAAGAVATLLLILALVRGGRDRAPARANAASSNTRGAESDASTRGEPQETKAHKPAR